MPTYGKGYVADAPWRLKRSIWRAHQELGIWAFPTPRKLLLKPPGILDQGATGSCTGHATALAVWTKLGGMLPSPIAPYTGARMLSRAPDATAPLLDEGAEPAIVMQPYEKFGAPPAAVSG